MLLAAKKNLQQFPKVKFKIADVEHLPFDNQYFDAALAHYMLYHTDSPKDGLLEIKRVLKQTGFCGILLPDKYHLSTIFSILECDNPGHASSFSSEDAYDLLPTLFNKMEDYAYRDEIKITNATTIIKYIRSLANMDKKGDHFYLSANKRLTDIIEKDGYIKLSLNQYLFIVKD